jgi:hypothetical protein
MKQKTQETHGRPNTNIQTQTKYVRFSEVLATKHSTNTYAVACPKVSDRNCPAPLRVLRLPHDALRLPHDANIDDATAPCTNSWGQAAVLSHPW